MIVEGIKAWGEREKKKRLVEMDGSRGSKNGSGRKIRGRWRKEERDQWRKDGR